MRSRKQQAEALEGYRKLATQLSAARQTSARALSKDITARMQTLGMAGGRFLIDINQANAEPAAHGFDAVEFRVTANPGQPLRPLAKVASGGELARLSLAVQVACSAKDARCMVFDEVDSGVGGAVAEIVGRELKALGFSGQALCVTHLPQVASQGHHHLRVAKLTDGKTTRTTISELTMDERAEELARMLGGMEVTGKAREHAREMLQMAGKSGSEGAQRQTQGLSARGSCGCSQLCFWRLLRALDGRAARLAAMAVQRHRVIAQLVAQPGGDRFLAFFDRLVDELFDAAAVQTHDMVVMRSLVELEHGHAVFEMVPRHQARGLELREHAIHRGEADVLVRFDQALVDAFGRHVTRRAALENFEDLEPRSRDLEARPCAGLCFPSDQSPKNVAV